MLNENLLLVIIVLNYFNNLLIEEVCRQYKTYTIFNKLYYLFI